MQGNNQAQGWHVTQWGTWGWVETILKLVAIAAGLLAFVRTLSASQFFLGDNPHLAALIVLVLLTLASIAQLAIRFGQRETVSMIFAILNLLGHIALVLVLLRARGEVKLPVAFGVFYVLGQLTKIQFLRVTGYTEGGANTSAMLRTTVIIAVLYALFTIFMLL